MGNLCISFGNDGLKTVSVLLTPAPNKAAPTSTAKQSNCVTLTPKPGTTSTPKPGATAKPTATSRPTASPAPTADANYTPGSVTSQEQASLKYINEDRAKNNLAALPMDANLQKLARMKSQDMADNNYFSHTSPTYGSPSQMLKDAGYSFVSVGENIAHHASVYKAHAALMSSTGHRNNILGSQWTRAGIGVAFDDQGYPYITQLFCR